MSDWYAELRVERARVVPVAAWRALTARLWPGGRFLRSEPIVGGLGALIDRVVAHDAQGARVTAIARRFPAGGGNGPEEIRQEVETLRVLARCEAPAPRPLWSDPAGEVLGRPALAMTEVPGRALAAALDTEGAALAGRLLARLHRIPGNRMAHVPDPGDLRVQIAAELSGSVPRADDLADRHELHAAIERGAQLVDGQQETFRHDDFHPGNVVRDGPSAAVVDLTWAGRGDPGRDVGYCRLDLALTAVAGTTEAFLAGYREAGGVVPDHLWLYDLLGVLRCLPTPGRWLPSFHEQGRTDLTVDVLEDRARGFIADALARSTASGVQPVSSAANASSPPS
ncbi:MAG: aminoglycoside phosphotransferase family protein [Nitriliruptoraceae bacterium]|nr:aminoglycoside phosphotransferase family protein [Nitriliruptoraceae bacterium]